MYACLKVVPDADVSSAAAVATIAEVLILLGVRYARKEKWKRHRAQGLGKASPISSLYYIRPYLLLRPEHGDDVLPRLPQLMRMKANETQYWLVRSWRISARQTCHHVRGEVTEPLAERPWFADPL